LPLFSLSSHIFGLKSDVANNVVYVDDQTVAYPAGHSLIIYSLDEKRQKFITATENTSGITAIAIAASRRFIAVAEQHDRGLVSVYDLKTLKKRKVLSSAETQGVAYVCMEFSADGQLLLTQGGAPDWILTCWNWSKGKAVATIKSPLHVTAGSAALPTSPSASLLGHQFGSVSGLGMAGLSTANLHSTAPHGNGASSGDANSSAADATGNGHNHVVTACSFSHVDPGLVCVTGANLVRYFRLLENAFRPMPSPRMESHVFLSHCWIKQRDDAMVAGTSDGDLLLFHSGEFVSRLLDSPGETRPITTLLSTTKGVLAGLNDATVYLYAVQGDGASHVDKNPAELLVLQRKIRVENFPSSISTLCVSPNEDTVVVSLSSGQLLMFPYQQHASNSALAGLSSSSVGAALTSLGNAAAVRLASGSVSSLSSTSDELTGAPLAVSKTDEVEYVVAPFHRPNEHGQLHVTGMDVCVRKPMLVTCGLDRTVRVWNYLERSCDVAKQFPEEAHSVACHPSGLYLLVGFADKLRLLNILMDDIRAFKEFAVKACRECQFSTGGHLFAAVNGNTIQVFNFFSCELVANLRGHNGKVKCLYWNHDDSSLISAGMDGAVYQWDLDDAKREAEFVQKGVPYSSALCNKDGTAIYAVGSDRMLKEIELPSCQLTKEFLCDSVLGQIVLSHSQRMLFGATAESDKPGAVRSFKFPLTGESIEFQCLSAPVARLRISFDDGFLFAAGEDGCVCIFEIRDKEGRPRMNESSTTGGSSSSAAAASSSATGSRGAAGSDLYASHAFSEEVLVTKSDLEEKNTLMLELKNKVDELMLHNEYQLRLKDMTYNENLKELTEKFTHEIELEKNKFELLREDKNDIEMEYEEKIKQLEEKHVQQLQEVEAEYQHRIMKEVEKYQDVLQQREAQRQHWVHERERLIGTHDKYVGDVTDDFETRLNEDRQLRVQLEDERDELAREYTETVHQVEMDVDQEIENLKKRYEDKLQAEREATLRFKGENGIMKKKFSALQKDIEDQRDQIKSLLETEKDLIEEIKTLEKEIQSLKREIRARDETIGEKEKRIYDLKKKNQELEKFKFVLDYKIKELKRQIEPRENEIADMKEQIKEMDHELELFHKSNAQLDLLIGEQRKRINAMQHETASYRKVLCDQQSWVRRFRCDLYACVQHIQTPQALVLEVAGLYQTYVASAAAVPQADVDREIQQEYARQKEYLEKSVSVLKQKYAHDTARHQQDHLRATADNMLLIKEINELRNAVATAKATVQMERAAMGAREARDAAAAKHRNDHRGIDGIIVDHADVDALVDTQRHEIDELRRAIKALEDRMASGSATAKAAGEGIFPPIRGVDG
jgi:cilia- and flagella-associated protein 57